MTGPRRVALEVAVALAVALLAAAAVGPAGVFAESVSIEETGAQTFPQRAYALEVPGPVAIDAESVTVTENGEPVSELRVESAAEGASDSFATVLVIDASNSMAGSPIAGAMRAARAFAEHRAPDQKLAVLTFNREPRVLLPFSSDDREIAAALSSDPQLDSSSHLYDAADEALAMLVEAGATAGTVVVLSDGADNGSGVGLAELVEGAEAVGMRIFTVGLRSEKFEPGVLEDLAVRGVFVEAAEPDDLTPILERFGVALGSEYLLGYRSGAQPGAAVTVEVRVPEVEGVARDHYEAPTAATPAPLEAPDEEGFWSSSVAMLAALTLACGLFGVAFAVLLSTRQESVRERVGRFLHPELRRGGQTAAADGQRAEAMFGALRPIERAMTGRQWWDRFVEELEVAGVEVPAVRIAVATFLGTMLAALLITQVLDIGILAPLALLVPFGVRMRINKLLREQRDAFAEQLGDNLQVVTSALRAGQSMVGAFGVVVAESPEPSRAEFRRIVNDERLGVSLEEAIRDVARRMDNRDMDQLALVARIQRETGGNTAEVLDQLIATIRERAALRRLMKTLTAQGRLTQIIVSVLPLVLLVAVTLLQPDYMEPLFETAGGHIALGIGALLSVIGSLVIKRIVEVRV